MKTQDQETIMNVENQEITEETPKRGFKMMWMMALCCGAPILGVTAITALGLQYAILDNLVLLACPIGMGVMMLVMMRGKKPGSDGADAGHACCPPMTAKKEPIADRHLEEANDSVQVTKISTVSQP